MIFAALGCSMYAGTSAYVGPSFLSVKKRNQLKMNVLFVHNNFPAQFEQLARALSKQPGTRVSAIGAQNSRAVKDVRLITSALSCVDLSSSHPFAHPFDPESSCAEPALYSLS